MFIATHQFEEASTFAGIQQRLCEFDHNKDRPSDKEWGENGGWAGASSWCSYICHWLRSGGDDQLGSNCNADDKIIYQDHDHHVWWSYAGKCKALSPRRVGRGTGWKLWWCALSLPRWLCHHHHHDHHMTTHQASATQTIPTSSSSTDPELASDITLSSLWLNVRWLVEHHDHRHQCNDHDNHDVHESENHHERNISKLALIEFKHHYEWIPCEPPRTWYLNHHNHWDLMMIASSLLQASYTAKAIAMIAESGAKAVSLKMEVIVVKFRHQYCESFWLNDF